MGNWGMGNRASGNRELGIGHWELLGIEYWKWEIENWVKRRNKKRSVLPSSNK
jgi:hypothetical protein